MGGKGIQVFASNSLKMYEFLSWQIRGFIWFKHHKYEKALQFFRENLGEEAFRQVVEVGKDLEIEAAVKMAIL